MRLPIAVGQRERHPLTRAEEWTAVVMENFGLL